MSTQVSKQAVQTRIGVLEVHFVDANRARVCTPDGDTVTVQNNPYTANIHFTCVAGSWSPARDNTVVKRRFPDCRPAPMTVVASIVAVATVALRAALEQDPSAPDRAEAAFAEYVVQLAQNEADAVHAKAARADEKLAAARRRLETARSTLKAST